MPDELKRLLSRVHDGVTTFDFDGRRVPCIVIEASRYDDLLSEIAGRPLSIDTNLNILQDGLGHVFVDVVLEFSKGGMVERFMVNAKTDLAFFESLADATMLALSSPRSHYGRDNVFMIQLPNPARAQDALAIIRKALTPLEPDGAVTGI